MLSVVGGAIITLVQNKTNTISQCANTQPPAAGAKPTVC
jgi:hypothetical protein